MGDRGKENVSAIASTVTIRVNGYINTVNQVTTRITHSQSKTEPVCDFQWRVYTENTFLLVAKVIVTGFL